MRVLRLMGAGLALLVLLAACADGSGSGSQPQARPLPGTSWILTEVAADSGLIPAVDASGSLTFGPGGELSGSTGCNRFTGTFTEDGQALSLQTGPMTRMACPEPLQAQEEAVMAALAATTGYRIEGQSLTLTAAAGDPLARYTEAVTDLTGTSWRATGVNNGRGGVVTTEATGELTLVFAADGTVRGFGGCTEVAGGYRTEGAGIAITDLQPSPPCTDSQRATLQQEYLAALAAATNFAIDGTRLDLRDESGALQVGLEAAE